MEEKHDYTALFQQQRRHFIKEIKGQSLADRRRKLKKMKDWIKQNQTEIVQSVHADFRKPPEEILFTEIKPVLGEINDALVNLRKWSEPRKVDAPLFLLGTKSEVIVEPKGVVLVIAPWNFPFQLTIGPVISALAAGNCITIKPSELTPNTEALIGKMIAELFNENEVAVVSGNAAVGAALLKQPWNHIFFTGSPKVGKIVMKEAAERLTSVTLELGGRNPAIVDETANTKDAAEKLLWGKCLNAGQSCISINYLLVHESKYDKLLEDLKSAFRKQYNASGNEMKENPAFARIVNHDHFLRIKNLVDDALDGGAELLIGGEFDSTEDFISPTFLTNVSKEAKIFQEEIFGPVLPIFTYQNLEEVFEIINQIEIPLALYLFTKSAKNRDKVMENTTAGTTCINETSLQFIHPSLPFGGHNFSGIGKAHGHYGFQAFSNERAVLKQNVGVTTAKLIYPPFTGLKRKLIDIVTWKM